MSEKVTISSSPKYDINGNCYYELAIPTGEETYINATLSCETVPSNECQLGLFTFLLNEANSSSDPYSHIDRLLDTGVVMPKSAICCPSCGPYMIGSIETFGKFIEAIGSCYGCCVSARGNNRVITILEEILSFYGLSENYPCDNDFITKINALLSEMNSNTGKTYDTDYFLDKGIVEYGSLNANFSSSINNLEDFLYSGNFTETEDIVFNMMIDKGVVLYCSQYWTVVASVETFLKYGEATGVICPSPPPPPA